MPHTDSPLRYPGGKSQLKKFIIDILEKNNINNSTYIEPFAGGAGIAISLLYDNLVDNIIINDLDTSIYYFWKSIIENTSDFIYLIKSTPVTIEQWEKQKMIYNQPDFYSELEVGFATFFLNRTNVSGIISGGPIGGYDQFGSYSIDCRFNKDKLISKIQKIASFKENIHITNFDAVEFINNILIHLDKESTFIFFDPPYYEQGKNLYANFFEHTDHVNLCNHIKSLKDYYWITTYDLSNEIEKMYNLQNTEKFRLRYSANKKRKAAELLFYSDKVKIPFSEKVEFINKSFV